MSDLLTPYAVAKIANTRLLENGLAQIPPQMVYTYTAKGFIDGTKGTHYITPAAAEAWVEKYVARKLAKAYPTK